MRSSRAAALFAVLALTLAVAAAPASAQEGKLKVRVRPKQAYVFVDGRALGKGSRTLSLSPGSHEVGVYNYGYRPQIQSVSIAAGQTTNLNASLTAVGGPVAGPWGRIQIEGVPGDTAVLLNGKTPGHVVGHADEFNHDWFWKQELLVPPGTHQLTLMRGNNELWSGTVQVEANQRVIIKPSGTPPVDVGAGQRAVVHSERGWWKTTRWSRGAGLGSVPRFRAGMASATVAVAPVLISNLGATPPQISCGDSSLLAWQTSEASEVTLDNQSVGASGEQLVTPRANTTYSLRATGPGGRVEQSATVSVNSSIEASLSVSPGEIRYRRIGDRVVEHGTATVTWSTSNADSVTLQAEGGAANSVPASGSQTVQPTPRQTTTGPVSETVSGTLAATNPCGAREIRTATLRITGSIEPLPEVVLASIFFPTDYPDERHPNLGLLGSQRRALSQLADGFQGYLEYDPNARLLLEAHADERASLSHNRNLSERRAAIVKQFLVDAGLSAAQVEFQAFGEEENLERTTVEALEEQNPNAAPQPRLRSHRADWLAHNRRVDIVLRPGGERSQRYYPHHADDSNILWQVPKPSPRTVEQNQ